MRGIALGGWLVIVGSDCWSGQGFGLVYAPTMLSQLFHDFMRPLRGRVLLVRHLALARIIRGWAFFLRD